MYASIIDQYVVHLEVSVHTIVFVLKLDKRVLKRVASLLVSDYLTAQNWSKSRKNDLQIFVCCRWVQLADKEDIFWWFSICIGDVSDHFEDLGTGFCLSF